MPITERLKLQGIDPKKFTFRNLDEATMSRQIGNSMSVNILERLIPRVLAAAGLQPANYLDRWTSGVAFEALRSDFSSHDRMNCRGDLPILGRNADLEG